MYHSHKNFCIKHSRNLNPIIRGNSILSFGHIARRFGRLALDIIGPIAKDALVDQSEYVRGQAFSASEDLHQFIQTDIEI